LKISIASDHGGRRLKDAIALHLRGLGHAVDDLGTHSDDSCDYPDFAQAVASRVATGEADRGVLVCGTGIGMSIAANKVAGVRAAVVSDPFCAQMAMEHNDARVLCLGERTTGAGLALMCVDHWLSATFQGGRHERRVAAMTAIESRRASTLGATE
jgi:ribose 5-phosphate isomerase B